MAATEAVRKDLAADLVNVRLEAANEDDIDGPRRRIAISKRLAGALNIDDGDLIELRSAGAVPLRGWARIAEGGPEAAVAVGPLAMKLLRARAGDRIELRAVRAIPAAVA